MPSPSSERGLVEMLADDFLARHKNGDKPTIREYCDRHPEHADEIRDVFEALLMVEDLKPGSGDISGSYGESVRVDGKRLEHVGDYRILREIGRGGMGVVYEAEQEALGRRVALKVLPRGTAGDSHALVRFQREAKAAARMHHTNIVPVFDVGQDGDYVYYAMQLIHGQGLDGVIDDLKRLRGQSLPSPSKAEKSIAASLMIGHFEAEQFADASGDPDATAAYEGSPPSSAVLPGRSELSTVESNRRGYYRSVAEIGVQTASALAYAHARGIIHRDIKPANLLLDAAGNVWVTDFGLAKTGDGGVTHTGDILGTIRYMSPERFRGHCDVRADVYGLGMTLYEMLVLKPAFASPDRLKLIELIRLTDPPAPRSLDPRIPRDLETIVTKAIDKDPRRRYQSADDLAEDLQRFVADEPIKARRVGPAERFMRWCRRHPAVAGLTAAVFLLMAAGTAISLWQAGRATRAEAEARDNESIALAAQAEAKTERDNFARANDRLERLAREQRQTLYASGMNLAQAAWEAGNPARTLEILDELAPKDGEEDLRGFEWHHWKSLGNRDLKTTFLPGSDPKKAPFAGAVLTGDGRMVIVHSAELKRLRVLEVDSGRETWSVPFAVENQGFVTISDASADGSRFATLKRKNPMGSENAQITSTDELRVWEVRSDKPVYSFDSSDGWSLPPQLSPDGEMVAWVVRSLDHTAAHLTVRRVSDGTEILRYPRKGEKLLPTNGTFSPDGRRIAWVVRTTEAGGVPGTYSIKVLDLDGGGEFELSLGELIVARPRFSPDSLRLVATVFGDGQNDLAIWDLQTRRQVQLLRSRHFASFFREVEFDPAGKILAVAVESQILLLDVDPGRKTGGDPLLRVLPGHTSPVESVAFGSTGSRLHSVSMNGEVKVWDAVGRLDRPSVAFGSRNFTAPAHLPSPDLSRIAILPGGRNVAGQFRLTDRSGRTVGEASLPQGYRVAADFGRDGRTFALAWETQDKKRIPRLMVWDAVAGKEWFRKDLSEFERAYFVVVSPDSSRVALTATTARTALEDLVVWDAVTGAECFRTKAGDYQYINSLVYSADGRWIVGALGGPEKKNALGWWDASSGELRGVFPSDYFTWGSIAFSPDSQRFAVSNSDGAATVVTVWDWPAILRGDRPKPLATLRGHGSFIDRVAFSPGGRRILTCGRGNVKLWDAASGRELLTLKADGFNLAEAYFDPSGNTIWAGLDADGQLWGWDATQQPAKP